MNENVPVTDQQELLRLELEETRTAYHALLLEISEEEYRNPSVNPAWKIGELLYHIITAVRFLPQDVRLIRSGRMFTPPAWLFNFFNVWFTRIVGRRQNRASLAAEYDRCHQIVLDILQSIGEDEWQLSADYPDVGGAMDGSRRSLADMFYYLTEHYQEHAADIRQSISTNIATGQ